MDQRGRIVLDSPPSVEIPAKSRDHFLLRHEDLVVTRTGATIGKCALFSETLGQAVASAYLIRYRLTRRSTLPQYLLTFLLSPNGQAALVGGSTAVAQPNVNTATISTIPVPIPPLAEQHEIVRRVEALFKLADAAERRVAAASARADRIAAPVLAKAFRGELVSTEAELARREGRAYEPATLLLERIRAARGVGEARIRLRPERGGRARGR